MLRLALGGTVLAAALFLAVTQQPSVPRWTDDVARPAAPAHGSHDCSDAGHAWNPQPDADASSLGSSWRCRSLQAAFASTTERGNIVSSFAKHPSRPRAPAAPAHLQHIPLLI